MTATRKKRAELGAQEWMTVPQAARALAIANATVLSRAIRGELVIQTIAGRVFVSAASVEQAKGAA